MIFLLKFLALFALIGGVLAFLVNGRSKEAFKTGAISGIAFGFITAVQLILIGLIALLGIWFLTKVF